MLVITSKVAQNPALNKQFLGGWEVRRVSIPQGAFSVCRGHTSPFSPRRNSDNLTSGAVDNCMVKSPPGNSDPPLTLCLSLPEPLTRKAAGKGTRHYSFELIRPPVAQPSQFNQLVYSFKTFLLSFSAGPDPSPSVGTQDPALVPSAVGKAGQSRRITVF